MPTIGVAIAIPEPWAEVLQKYRASFGDSQADAIPTHITLVPPTCMETELAQVQAHLEKVAKSSTPFRLRLRGTATFRPTSPVVFVTLVEGISACEELADAVRRGPLAVDLTFPYHPHVTVAHHLDEEALDRAFMELGAFECEFNVDDFHLYVHDERHGWQPTQRFALQSIGH